MSDETMREKLGELTSRSPRSLGYDRSRWTLGLLREHLGAQAPETDSGLSRMLGRLGITWTRGQGYTLSPDEQFEAKRAFIDGVRTRVQDPPGHTQRPERPNDRLFYLDELTYALHPTRAASWSPAGTQPTARRAACGQQQGRLLAAMEVQSGRLFYRQEQTVSREVLVDLYREMTEAYRGARLWVVQDNAPFHFHPDVLRPLEAQVWPRAHPGFEYVRPPTWEDPTPAAQAEGTVPVQIVPLPTYASWLNPIERLWRWLKQEVVHLHPYAEDWDRLKQGVRQFLDRFVNGSTALLEYTGLSSA